MKESFLVSLPFTFFMLKFFAFAALTIAALIGEFLLFAHHHYVIGTIAVIVGFFVLCWVLNEL